MPELNKVIYSIERCICHVPDACQDCAYDAGHPYNECVELLLRDAHELLKAQEPRVMTLKEIISAECVWIEYATSGNVVIALPWDIELTDDTYNFIGMPNCFVEFRSLYGEEWRCWTGRPTDEQRKAAKWDEPQKEE